ncbi:hypothetical protein HNY73_016311 [Argiope bruennichi]|uniref:Uncharacterized protein n=1 Tax=Argiope bruennichi TaxID=94029 RepID=A0A8T0EJM5_ARGBR|nr:hypothetical protein HNY73_016311 [Argiope bruennichi]
MNLYESSTIHLSSPEKLNSELDYNKRTNLTIETENGFRLLKKIFTFFGLNISTEEAASKERCKILRLFSIMNIYVAYLLLIDIRSYFEFSTSLGLSISLSSGTLIVVALRVLLLKNLKLIRLSLKNSYDLLCTIRTERHPTVMPRIFMSFTICSVVSILFIALYVYDCDTETSIVMYQDYFFFGWLPSNNNRIIGTLFYALSSFLECMDLITMYTFPGMVLILCAYQFCIIVALNKALAQRVQIKSHSIHEAMDEFINFYSSIELAMKDSERAISPIVFFVYGYILSCLYQVTGALVTKFLGDDVISDQLVLFICIMLVLFGGVASFLSLSFQTFQLNQSANLVRRNIFALLSSRKAEDVNFASMYVLLLLADNYPKQIVVTGWGFFPLDGHFALKALGGIITYAVIMVQISDSGKILSADESIEGADSVIGEEL